MLKIQKETLTELTSDQLGEVVGGTIELIGRSCFAASCITGGPQTSTFTMFIASGGC